MQYSIFALAIAGFLTACGGPSIPADARKALTLNRAEQDLAFQSARQVQVNGLTFTVAKIEKSYGPLLNGGVRATNRPYALVELSAPKTAPYTVRNLEQATRMATGCSAAFNSELLIFVGAYDPAKLNLQGLREKVKSSVRGWRVNLSC